MIRKLKEAECRAAMETGEFDKDLVSGPQAAVILTQSWCPQWTVMKAYLPQVEAVFGGPDKVKLLYAEYDIEKWESIDNDDFKAFKENTFSNREIPYVRYYKNGVFARDSNYLSFDGFKGRLGG